MSVFQCQGGAESGLGERSPERGSMRTVYHVYAQVEAGFSTGVAGRFVAIWSRCHSVIDASGRGR